MWRVLQDQGTHIHSPSQMQTHNFRVGHQSMRNYYIARMTLQNFEHFGGLAHQQHLSHTHKEKKREEQTEKEDKECVDECVRELSPS